MFVKNYWVHQLFFFYIKNVSFFDSNFSWKRWGFCGALFKYLLHNTPCFSQINFKLLQFSCIKRFWTLFWWFQIDFYKFYTSLNFWGSILLEIFINSFLLIIFQYLSNPRALLFWEKLAINVNKDIEKYLYTLLGSSIFWMSSHFLLCRAFLNLPICFLQ